MICYSLIQAVRKPDGSINYSKSAQELFMKGIKRLDDDDALALPCGKCIGCRLDRSRQWAMRCMHEAQMHDKNCFITLTYDEDNIPHGRTLVKSDFQKFMKRLRKKFGKVRYYMCGEYGENFGRPHYHACLFGFDFDDKLLWKRVGKNNVYISESLQKLWPFGFSTIGAMSFESAAYVARYVMKKRTGKMADVHYQFLYPETGELIKRLPEYNDMSRNPGIAKEWFDKFYKDVYPSDEVIVNGKRCKPPRYYDKRYELICTPEEFQALKDVREEEGKKNEKDTTYRRLKDREVCKEASLSRLKRSIA